MDASRATPNDVGLGAVQLPNVLPDLAQALTRNPALRVFSANGYFDLATPYFGTEKDLHHLGLDPALRSHITYGFYSAGHMIYLEPASRMRAPRRYRNVRARGNCEMNSIAISVVGDESG